MNKWIKVYMEEHDLKPNERFEIVQEKDKCKYFFREDGQLCIDVGTNYECVSFHILGSLMDGIKIEKVKPKGRYIPKLFDMYYYVSDLGNILGTANNEDESDSYIFEHNLVFRTKEEAEDYKWFLDQVYEYKRTFEKDGYNYCFYFDVNHKRLDIDYSFKLKYDLSYFGSEENIKEFRSVVGDERIKKYMFNIWE